MRFNLIYDFHKNANWSDFYFEYIELKKYLKDARKFMNKQVKYECKRHPSNTNLQHVRELILEQNKITQSKLPNSTNMHNTNSHYVTILKEVEHFENFDQFSKKYIKKFNKKIKKVEDFFLNVRDDLKADFNHLKHLVLTCEDIEEFQNQNVLANLQSIKHDYKWRESKEGDEITCRLAFIHLFRLVSVLENFTLVNEIAANEIIFKYAKHFPEDELTLKQLNKELDRFKDIIKREENFKFEILKFYAEQFFKGYIEKALKEFELKKVIPKKSKLLIFQVAMIPILLLTFLLLTYLVDEKYKFTIEKIHVFFPAFSFTLMVILFFIYTCLIISIFKKYKINYIYLLELDPELLYSPENLLKYFLTMLIIWFVLLIGYRVSLSYFFESMHSKVYLFSVFILALFFVFIFWPFAGLLRKIRICLLIVVVKCLCPFTKRGVKFKDFLFADILTSFGKALGNMSAAICLLYCDKCIEGGLTNNNCHKNYAVPFFLVFPVFIRIMQCSNMIYYGQKRQIEIVNILKYSIHASESILGWCYGRNLVHFYTYIICVTISSTFLVLFDMRIDWNVFKFHSQNFLLRDRIIYPKWFYYYAMIVNLILRQFWFLSFVLPLEKDWILLVANFFEIYRRAQWTLIRVENEQLYNLEGYRKYLPIPEMPLH